MTQDTRQCSVRISKGYSAYDNPLCHKPAVVERDGKWFCRIHDPEYIKAKQAKWQADFDKKFYAEQERAELRTARATATRGLTLTELRRVTPELIRKALKAETGN